MLLGDNIGTTVTAVLASIGQSRDTKRAAAAHALFNLTGAAAFCALLQWYAGLVAMISPKGPELEVIAQGSSPTRIRCSTSSALRCGCR